MHAYVTGATGCIGYHLVRELLKEGWDITVLHRQTSDISIFRELSVRLSAVDLYDIDSVRRSIKKDAGAIFHVAGNVSHQKDPRQWKDNVLTTRNLVEVALEKGVSRFIYTSTGATLPYYGRMNEGFIEKIRSGYIRTKKQGELEVLKGVERGLHGVILQPVIVIGEYDFHRHYSVFFEEEDLRVAIPGKLEFCDAKKIARAHIEAFYHGQNGENYVLGGEYLTWFDFLAIVAKITGAKPPIFTAPKWLLYVVAFAQTVWGKITQKPPKLTVELVSLLGGEERVSTGDRLRTQRDLHHFYEEGDTERVCRRCFDWLKNTKEV